jgi:uncharacterized BrkB/YihY/UPF0761 family membrane protein
VIFASPAAIGAGLQVAACALEHEAKIGAAATVLSAAISITVYVVVFYALYSVLMRRGTPSAWACSRGRRPSWSCPSSWPWRGSTCPCASS